WAPTVPPIAPAPKTVYRIAGNTTMAGMPRSVVVTGAADGIGRGIARHFAQLGDAVALLDYTADKLERTTAELAEAGGKVISQCVDVQNANAVDGAIARVVDAHGGVDIAVNNAAVYPNTAVIDMSEDEW